MTPYEQECARLAAQRESSYQKLGQLEENVLSRMTPGIHRDEEDDSICFLPWPSSALGQLRIIYREKSTLIVTDGLSDPWDKEIHGDETPEDSFGFEAAIEIPITGKPDQLGPEIAQSWMPRLLWSFSDWLIYERQDVVGVMSDYGLCSLPIPPIEELEEFVCDHGYLTALVGMPLEGDAVGSSIAIAKQSDGEPIFLIPLKILTPDEYAFVTKTRDAKNAEILAKTFFDKGERHLIWKDRKSVLTK